MADVSDVYITKNLERNSITIDACSCKITFLDWLWERHQTTPISFRVLCRNTARYGNGKKEYERGMEWFRRRYRMEMELRKQIVESNPFKEEKSI